MSADYFSRSFIFRFLGMLRTKVIFLLTDLQNNRSYRLIRIPMRNLTNLTMRVTNLKKTKTFKPLIRKNKHL